MTELIDDCFVAECSNKRTHYGNVIEKYCTGCRYTLKEIRKSFVRHDVLASWKDLLKDMLSNNQTLITDVFWARLCFTV